MNVKKDYYLFIWRCGDLRARQSGGKIWKWFWVGLIRALSLSKRAISMMC